MKKHYRHNPTNNSKRTPRIVSGITLLAIICLFCNPSLAQVKKSPLIKKSKLLSVAQSTKKEILIRWAPSDEGMWKEGNKYGYALERYTIMKDGKMLNRFESLKSKLIMKPKPVAAWDSLIQNDDYAAVLAQAIYGDDFDVEMSAGENGLARIINETEKLKQRYNMAMYAVDHSFTAAQFGGLGWTDSNVKSNEKYFYRIYSLIPKELRKTDTTLVYIGLDDYKPLPKPSEIVPEFSDRSVLLKWDFNTYKEYYTSYIVERSDDDGKTFKPVSDKPVTTLNEEAENSATTSMLYIDTLANNTIEYQYRIAGLSLFGNTGPYSDVVKGKGKFMLPLTPNIVNVSGDEGNYHLNWEFDDSLNSLVKEFRINHSEKVDGPYAIVHQQIQPGSRSIAIDSLSSSNYYTVTVVSNDGQERTSLPYFLQPEDSIPPAMPIGLRASIDSNGVVDIRWDANTEKDLSGYRIWKTTVKGHELVPLFDSVWHDNIVKDTVNLKSLNNKIYYTVKAIDNRYNQSEMAPLLEVKIPDIIPPTQPVLSDYALLEKGISIKWINSSDEDVASHSIYRKQTGTSADWKLLKTIGDKNIVDFSDTSAAEGKTYSYTIIATDSSQLESAPAIPLTISVPEKHVKEAIGKLVIEADRQNRMIAINWELKKETKSIKQFEIYRGWDKQPMSLYQQLDKNQQSFTDKELRVNTKYKYAVRAVYTNGGYSDFVVKNITY